MSAVSSNDRGAGAHPLDGWTPVEVSFPGGRPTVRWCFTEGIDFTDPFFSQTVEHCLQNPFRLLFSRETDLAALATYAAASPGLSPSGFIFHLSRCGSTLLTQMLAALADVTVMSEPDPMDMVLRAQTINPDIGDNQIVDWLGWMASALGQKRHPAQTHFVIKFDAWAILQLPLIRQAFPDTPCVFVYRDPVEVMVSQLGHRGYHMVPGTLPPAWIGLSSEQVQSLSPVDYCAIVLGRLCQVAAQAAQEGSIRLVHYNSLPGALGDVIAPFFGVGVGADERRTFARVAALDAKNPFLPFLADAEDKQSRATPDVRAAVASWVTPCFEQLEDQRRLLA